MEINIEEYLSEEEIKQIIISKLKESVVFDNEEDIKRIISNTAYNLVWEKVGDVFNESIEVVLRDKIKDIISGMSEYSIFKKPDAWDREPNSAYKFLQKCIDEEKDNIKNIVKTNLPVDVIRQLKEEMTDLIQESIKEFYKEM